MLWLALVFGCSEPPVEGPDTVAWSGDLPDLAREIGPIRGRLPLRSIVHLHSPYSHDACDGDGWVDGQVDEACLADLRDALCRNHVDVAFVTDHPAHAAEQAWSDWLLARDADRPIEAGGQVVGNTVVCADGHEASWLPGVEDQLMPVGLDRHVADSPEENSRLYNADDSEAIGAFQDAGALVLVAHTEGRDPATLEALQDRGLDGVEVFNLHAMFAPDIREQDLGLPGLDWLYDIGDFVNDEGTSEPDLLFLAVLQEQAPSLERYDALSARAPTVAVAGTDAHQNVLPLELGDGERGDAYRRMLRWFSNVLVADDRSVQAAEEALAAGRSYVAFEALGTPQGFDFHVVDDGGAIWEMGSEAPQGTLVVACPTLSRHSPRGLDAPEVAVTVYRNGEPWRRRCGSFAVDGPATYRVRVDITPHHLAGFLGDPERWIAPYPWVYGNAIRVGY